MKKLVYLFVALFIGFTSCNPMEDIDAALDEATKLDGVVGDVTYTLTPEDYGDGFDFTNEYFTSIADVESLMPDFISDQFPALGVKYQDGKIVERSLALIHYNLFDPVDFQFYTASAQDYTAIGINSLNTNDDFNKLLAYVFPGVPAGSVVELTYNKDPEITEYTLNDDDYDLVGNGRFDNFDIRPGGLEETEEARRLKIQTILLNNFSDANVDDKYRVFYEAFDGSGTQDLFMEVILTSNDPDPARVTDYTLTDADFAFVGNGQFNNFDIRPGRAEETIEARRVKIEQILLNNFPSAIDGDIYNVEYAVWVPGDEVRNMLLIKNGAGYDIFSALTYEFYTFALEEATTRFAFNDSWDAPVTFDADDYKAMDQNFPNFSNMETALYNIAIYLETLYPYATPETFLPVEFEVFRQGTKNVNFVFDGDKWNAIPDTIQTTAQFSHNGTTWEFDNTIKYTLTSADYALVGNDRFGNFDIREGRDEFEVSARLAKINTILLNNFPQYGEGQKFSVSYNVWKPGDDVFIMNVIHDGTNYILQE